MAASHSARRRWLTAFLAVAGPGLVVMLADNEAGSITTAAVSGAQWGYRLILLQVLLIPVLYVVQEMTVRLGTVTGKGHAQLIREHYGQGWAAFSLITLFMTNVAALLTEFAGVAGAGAIFGIPNYASVTVAALVLGAVVFTGSYRRAEQVALFFGLTDLLFVPAALLAHPHWSNLATQGFSLSQPLGNHEYLLLVASNIGAVIMPWMVFYQQSAVVDKGLRVKNLSFARWDTALGSVSTQLIMIAIIIATAATLHAHRVVIAGAAQAVTAMTPLAGPAAGLVFSMALTSSALLGAFVVSMSTAWAFGETLGWKHSLNHAFQEAPWFYLIYLGGITLAAAVVLIPGVPLVRLTVDVEAGNSFVLPVVLGFLLLLVNNRRILGSKVNRPYMNAVALGLCAAVAVLGVFAALQALG